MIQGGCVDFHRYLTRQGQPGDRHVGVQHLEFGLQRESHAERKKRREMSQSESKFKERRPTLCVRAPRRTYCLSFM